MREKQADREYVADLRRYAAAITDDDPAGAAGALAQAQRVVDEWRQRQSGAAVDLTAPLHVDGFEPSRFHDWRLRTGRIRAAGDAPTAEAVPPAPETPRDAQIERETQ
jgi:hypothetical protein